MNWKTGACLLWLSMAVLLAAPPAGAEEEAERVFTLQESIRAALDRNWNVKVQEEQINEAEAVKDQAWADFFPKLSTTYAYTRLDERRTTEPVDLGLFEMPGNVVQVRDNYRWTMTVTQPLFTGFALLSTYQLGKLGIDEAELGLELEKLDLALSVKRAYFRILEADRLVEVAEKAVESLQSHVDVARSFYQVGMIPINNLLEAEVELSNAEYELIQAKNAARLARASFNTILARPISKPVAVEDIRTFRPVSEPFFDYVEMALRKRPEIKTLDVRLEQTEQSRRLARSDYYPDISLQYDYIQEGDEPYVEGSPVHDANRWQVMAVLSWTFFEWGKTRSAVEEVNSVRMQLIQTRAALEDQIQLEINEAYLDLIEAEENIPTTTKAVEQAEENLRVSRERYEAQVATSTEVLDAQALLTRARTNYYRALYSHHLARARLERAIGLL
jgi:outer membrane protein TolC